MFFLLFIKFYLNSGQFYGKINILYDERSMNMVIKADNNSLAYMGRNDHISPDEVRMYYAGSQVRFSFRGTRVKVLINADVYWGELALGVILDGEMIKLPLSAENNGKDISLTIAENLADAEHSVIIYKKHAGNMLLKFKGIEIDGELLEKPELPELKMEVYGDSVCAGEVIEAEEFAGQCDPDGHNSRFDNVWNSFVMQTSRNINAQIHNICQGGIALFDGTGYFHHPDYIGLESVYDKACYFPEGGITSWDFSLYTPDIVVIAIGQNDQHNGMTDKNDRDITDPVYKDIWKTAYKKLVRSLNNSYGSAKFVLTTTVLMHDKAWDDAIEEIKNELNEEGIAVYHNMFTRNGAATPGHPRLSEHNEMAEELTAFIKSNVL